MRFQRQAKVLRGQLDVLSLGGTLLLLLIIVLLHSSWVFTAGVPIRLAETAMPVALVRPTVTVTVDERGIAFFQNQAVSEAALEAGLRRMVSAADEPVTLVLLADRSVPNETVVRLIALARSAGVEEALLATRPPVDRPSVGP